MNPKKPNDNREPDGGGHCAPSPGSVGSRFIDPDAVLREAEAWCEDVDRIDEEDRMHEEHMALALWDELRDVRRKWESDRAIFRGALQLLKEAGLAPGSTELIAAAERFDSQNTQAMASAIPATPTTPENDR